MCFVGCVVFLLGLPKLEGDFLQIGTGDWEVWLSIVLGGENYRSGNEDLLHLFTLSSSIHINT